MLSFETLCAKEGQHVPDRLFAALSEILTIVAPIGSAELALSDSGSGSEAFFASCCSLQ
jgi:hypothetical protein